MEQERILTNVTEIKKSISMFRSLLAKAAEGRKLMEWTFPDGERGSFSTFTLGTTEGTLLVGIPDRWGNRVPHLFYIKREGRALSPDVELNIPLGHDRSVSGAYLRNSKDIWLCHRGTFTSFRGRVPRQIAFQYFNKWLVEAYDENTLIQIIPIAALSSPTIVEDIAQFVQAVISLKTSYKESGEGHTLAKTPWSDWEEFEGKKNSGGGGESTSYEYMHGPICNSLNTWLKKWSADKPFEIKRNKNVDAAIVGQKKAIAIFEVKTSASLSAQLYTAIGQLLYYRNIYGGSKCALYLVLPDITVNQGLEVAGFLSNIKIEVVVRKDSTFKTFDGKLLSKALDKLISA